LLSLVSGYQLRQSQDLGIPLKSRSSIALSQSLLGEIEALLNHLLVVFLAKGVEKKMPA